MFLKSSIIKADKKLDGLHDYQLTGLFALFLRVTVSLMTYS